MVNWHLFKHVGTQECVSRRCAHQASFELGWHLDGGYNAIS